MMDREQCYEYADIWVKDYLRRKCDEINDWLCYKAPAYGGEIGKAKAI